MFRADGSGGRGLVPGAAAGRIGVSCTGGCGTHRGNFGAAKSGCRHLAADEDAQLPTETTVNAHYLPCPFVSRNTLKMANLLAVFPRVIENFNTDG